jgi:hypothetical protein
MGRLPYTYDLEFGRTALLIRTHSVSLRGSLLKLERPGPVKAEHERGQQKMNIQPLLCDGE